MRTVALLLSESLKSISLLDDPDIGLAVVKSEIILVHLPRLKEMLEISKKNPGTYDNEAKTRGYSHILGVLESKVDKHDPCYRAKMIAGSAAISGYGPALYEIGMVLNGRLAADRSSVSSSARRVWAKFADRPDVIRLPFDDVSDPETEDPNDDCRMHGTNTDREALDYAYSLKPAESEKVHAVALKLIARFDLLQTSMRHDWNTQLAGEDANRFFVMRLSPLQEPETWALPPPIPRSPLTSSIRRYSARWTSWMPSR